MPTFSDYPAMRVKVADIPGAIQRGRENVQKNQLYQMEIQSGIAEQGRLNQLRAVMPQIAAGDRQAIARGLALDPEQTARAMDVLGKMDRRERETMKQKTSMLGGLAVSILTAPPVQRVAMWPQAREMALANGANPENVPELYSEGVEERLRLWAGQADQIKTLLDQVPDTPTGYRRTEAGGLELSPGYLEGQRNLATAKRGPDGGATPAQQANNREIDEARKRLREIERKLEPGVSLTEEIHRRIGTTDPTTGRRILDFNTFLGRTAWMAMQRKVGQDQEQARWSRMLINPPEFSDPAGPKALLPGVPAEKPGILDRIGDYFSGGDDTPAPASDDGPRRGRPRGRGRVRGRSGSTKKPIRQMSKAEITDLLDERGEELTEDERKAIQARLDALGL